MDIVAEVRSFLETATRRLSADHFVAHDGTIYPRRNIESEFQHQLEVELLDPEKAQRILESFRTHLNPALDPDQQKIIKDWVVKNVRFIGCFPFFDYWKGVFEQPVKKVLGYRSNNERAFNAFLTEIREGEELEALPVVKPPGYTKNIVIITTSSGGGHESVAEALEQILRRFPEKYNVTALNTAKLFRSSDPLYRLSGLLSAEEIYDRIYQQRRKPALAMKLWKLRPKLNVFVPHTSMRELKDLVRPLHPHLIISTCCYLERDLELASSLGVLFRFILCDYEFNWALVNTIAKINSELVKFWIPTTDREALRPISSRLKSDLIQQISLPHPRKKIGPLIKMIEAKAVAAFEYSGFPVRSSFQRVSDPEVLATRRNRLHVAEGSQVVVLQMGKQGVGTLASLVKTLNRDRSVVYDRPLHVAVICGANQELHRRLIDYLNMTKRHPQLTFDILPFLSQYEIADYLSIADVEVMKPGGAATGEAIAMGVNTLMFMDLGHPWEVANRDQMVRHNLGTVVKSLRTLPLQLKDALAKPKNTDYRPINAIEAIPRLVDEAMKSS